jgi:dipeptidyl aminopeptidase/acylaminoacyl peptidase
MNAPELHPVQKEDLFRLKFLTGAALSPDGKLAVYGVSSVDPKTEKESTQLWLVSTESGVARPLTNGTTRDGNPQWSPDGKTIAFVSGRAGAPQIYRIPVDGGEARPLTSAVRGVYSGPFWSPDGRWLAYTTGPAAPPRDPSKPYRITRSTYRFDGMGYLDDLVHDIYIVSAEGGEPKRLTETEYAKSIQGWSPDGRELLFTAMFLPEETALSQQLRAVNLDGTVRSVLGGDFGSVDSAAWLPDGKRIVFLGQRKGLPIGSKNDLWTIDAQGGEPACRTARLAAGLGGLLRSDVPVNKPVGNLIPTPDGRQVFASVQEGGTMHVYRVALDGSEDWAPVTSGERSCVAYAMSAGKLLFVNCTFFSPSELHVCSASGADERVLSHLNDEVIAGWALPGLEHMLFPSVDGVQVEGWVLLPPTGQAPYPAVLYIHGGPHGSFGHVFHFDFQMLAGAGYAVVIVNHRASTGYGDAFSTGIKGDWGNLDYNDLMHGVDEAIRRGWVDGSRMGLAGISGGGNLSCWIVGQTDRFKAAVPENPLTNFVTMYSVGDLGPWFSGEELGGAPWQIPEVYARCSPITYAHKCKTPTLLIQGEMDFRCPAEQSEQFYAVLKANGCIVEMLRLPGSSHTGSITGAPVVRKAQNEALLDWMDRYLLGKPAVKEIA